VSLDFWLT